MSDLQKEVHDFLQTNRLTFKKSLGQHFLISRNILHTIIQAANIQPDDHIVEIGPGIGILTRELLKQTKHVTAIEIDTSLIPLLKAFTSGHSLEIINNDALRTAFPAASYKIVANIPYHITSPLLRHAFVESNPPTSLTLLIQKEVAEKICLPVRSSEGAKAGDTKYSSRLGILVGLFGTPKLITKVPPSAFLPPPNVDSAVLHIQTFKKPKAEPDIIERVFRLTHTAFGQKRKMLHNTISMELLEHAHIDPTRRPQTLSIDEWIALAKKSP
ncbi:ribosomal RNA small subunit methyltransferase A [Candidatus Peregrinibacteria bacterium]|nr:ribosomal RNA small subunit methyltransferase A [Candidatus Peregrinibacteria bacterium]